MSAKNAKEPQSVETTTTLTSPLESFFLRISTAQLIRVIAISIVVAIMLFGVAIALYWGVFGRLGWSDDQAIWGQFGDFFGGLLNPILAFLSFVALLFTVVLQSKEIRDSHRFQEQQSFESVFFQMLHRFDSMVEQLRLGFMLNATLGTPGDHYRDIYGRDALQNLYSQALRNEWKKQDKETDSVKRSTETYAEFYKKHHHLLGHYFRALYHIFSFINRSQLDDDTKVSYSNIARAQLSSFELALLFYNGTYGEGKEGFKPLIEKFGILKHIDWELLLVKNERDNRSFYLPTAFMGHEERKKYWKEQA